MQQSSQYPAHFVEEKTCCDGSMHKYEQSKSTYPVITSEIMHKYWNICSMHKERWMCRSDLIE